MAAETKEERLDRLAKPGDWVMKFAELEGPDGQPSRSITFVGVEFKPLGYEALAKARLHEPVTVPLDWHNAKVVETDVEGVNIDAIASGNATLESIFSSTTVSLQRGGWLPSGLGTSRRGVTVLPDRNVISQIKARYDGGAVVAEGRDFLDMLADLEIRINPLLFAMEGNSRSIPSPDVIESQLREAIELVAKALPKASMAIGDESLKGVVGIVEDTRPGIENKQRFLLDIAKSLEPPTARRLLDARWREILDATDRNRVPRNSLVVLAALSAAAVPNSGSPAKKLLKFRAGYAAGDAYNALADLRSLEILIHLYALFPEERPALFTADKALALFWTGIQAHNFRREGNAAIFDLAPVEQLFPGETIHRWQEASAAT
jgi:hypothetical protein